MKITESPTLFIQMSTIKIPRILQNVQPTQHNSAKLAKMNFKHVPRVKHNYKYDNKGTSKIALNKDLEKDLLKAVVSIEPGKQYKV